MRHPSLLLLHLSQICTAVVALCPMAELARRGLVSADVYKSSGINSDSSTDAHSNDPLSSLLSQHLGVRTEHLSRSATHNHQIQSHVLSRILEPDSSVNISSPILTPKAHRLLLQSTNSSLLGGILAPLTGILAALDIPTPQPAGLKAIPGSDPSHGYIPPGPTDIRGCCPTLNTLANHGYISRTGITTFAEATNAIQTAFALGFDNAIFVSALGLIAGGDIPTGIFSIGGADPRVPETLGPVDGIDRHGFFEIDSSPSRGDRFFGDNHSFNLTRWNKMVSDANTYGDGLFNIEAMKRNVADGVEESRATNPEFTFGPTFGATYATRAFIARPLVNGTNPDVADFRNVAAFYLNETFPENWYRLPRQYTLGELLVDIGDLFAFRPQPLGRNYGGRFIPLNVSVPEAPAEIGCLATALLASAAPQQVVDPVVQAINAVKDQILAKALGYAACDIAQFDAPGGEPAYSQPGENTAGGSGSGITHPGQWDDLTLKPSGKSAGQAT